MSVYRPRKGFITQTGSLLQVGDEIRMTIRERVRSKSAESVFQHSGVIYYGIPGNKTAF